MPHTPDRGDVIWLQFNPQSGHEQAGHRPALVLSPKEYNRLVGLALVCPITSKIKGYPYEVCVNVGDVNGVALSDQVKNLDWKARNARFLGKVPYSVIEEVREKLHTLI
ncbi:MAG: endoribonuclease MazF [Kiritimatiellae bacterium]|nr:endoribonuclease MazF [Kiritimatiellia bacterium]MDD4736147.1 endoribonuclease MazF [Kiritimatiellia bacterium]